MGNDDNIGQVRAANNGTFSRFYYLKDHLGNIRVTVNYSGTVDGFNDYYPFGGIMDGRSQIGSADKRYKFTGKERDDETGLDYFGGRFYDSGIGMWHSVDPLTDKYPGYSPYNYCLNNPLRFIDLKGLATDDPENVYYDKNNVPYYIYDIGAVITPEPDIKYPSLSFILTTTTDLTREYTNKRVLDFRSIELDRKMFYRTKVATLLKYKSATKSLQLLSKVVITYNIMESGVKLYKSHDFVQGAIDGVVIVTGIYCTPMGILFGGIDNTVGIKNTWKMSLEAEKVREELDLAPIIISDK